MFEELSENSQQYSARGKSTMGRQGVHEINTNDGVQAEMTAMNTTISYLPLRASKIQMLRYVLFVLVVTIQL